MYVETNLIVAHTYIHTRSFLLKIAAQGNAEKGRRGKLGKWGEFFPSQKILSRGNVRRWSGKGKLRSIFFFNKLLCIKGSHFVTKVFRKWLCESSFFERKRRSCTTAWNANRNCRWILIGKMKKWIHLRSKFSLMFRLTWKYSSRRCLKGFGIWWNRMNSRTLSICVWYLAVPEYNLWMIADTFPNILAYMRAGEKKY